MTDHITPTSVVVVHPYPILHRGIEFLLAHHPHLRFAGGSPSFDGFAALADQTSPAVSIFYFPMPAESGLAQIREIRKQYPHVGIIVLTPLEDVAYAERCFRLGVKAFLSMSVSQDVLLTAIERAAAGEVFCSDEIKSFLEKRTAEDPADAASTSPARLSNAEAHVLEMIGEGMTTQQIADLMDISAKTVETYKARIKQKLGFTKGSQLAHFAIASQIKGQ